MEAAGGTGFHTDALLRVEIKTSPARSALVRSTADAFLTASVTAATSTGVYVLKVAQWTVTNTCPTRTIRDEEKLWEHKSTVFYSTI